MQLARFPAGELMPHVAATAHLNDTDAIPAGVSARAMDDSALATWFRQEVALHETALRAYLRARYPELREIDDVVQEAYLRLFRERSVRPVQHVRGFLFVAARNAACDLFRKRKGGVIEYLGSLTGLGHLTDLPNGADAAATAQELELIKDAIRDLPERCRQVFTLRKIHGLSQKQIAAQLGISENTVEVHVANGVKRCAEYFKARGVTRP